MTPADLREHNELELESLLAARRGMVRAQRERDTVQMLLEAAELRCRKLDREIAHLSEEFRDTAMVAEAIVAVPSTPDAKVEQGLLDAIAIIDALGRSGRLTPVQALRLREIRTLVPS